MKGKILGIGAMVIVLLLSFSLSALAIYNISVPFNNSSFTLISMSYYLDEDGNKVNFGPSTGVWQTSPSTQMQFYVPGCTGIVPAYRFNSGSGNSWNAGEILQLKMTITDLSSSALFEQDPTKYRIVIQSGGTSLNFTASSVTYSDQTSGGYNNITVNFTATQTLEASVPVYGAVFQFYLPFSISATNTNPYILVDFGNLAISSKDGLDNINTQKVVDAIDGAVVEDFGYETPSDVSSGVDVFEDAKDKIDGWSNDIVSWSDGYQEDIRDAVGIATSSYDFLWCWFVPGSTLSLLVIGFAWLLFLRKLIK